MSNRENQMRKIVRGAMLLGGALILLSALFQLLLNFPGLRFVALFCLALVVSWPKFKFPIRAAEPLFFLVLLLFGSPAAILLAAVTALITHRNSFAKAKSNYLSQVGQAILSAGAAGLVYERLPFWLLQQAPNLSDAPISLITVLAWVAWVRFLFHADWSVLAENVRTENLWEFFSRGTWLNSFVAYFGAAFTAGVVLLVTREQHPHVALLSLLILTIFYFAYQHFKEKYIQKYLAVRHNAEEISDLHLRTIEALSSAIEAKDYQTHLHARRMQIYTEGLGRAMGLPDAELKALRAAALVRDIGKLAVPDHILHKADNLTEAELAKLKLHPIVGAEILERVGFPYPLVPAVKHHHEHWDGSGYPDRLRGTAIPVTARILAVVDGFDVACGNDLSANTKNAAIHYLRRESGHQFDPAIVEAFLANLPAFETRIAELVQPLSRNERALLMPAPNQEALYLDAIRRARLEGAELLELAQTLSSTLNLEEAVSIIISRLSRLLSFDTYAVYVTEETGNSAYVAGAIGAFADYLRSHQAFVGHGAIGAAFSTGQPSYDANPATEFVGFDPKLQQAFQEMTIIPLSKANRVIGAIVLLSKTAQDNSENLRVLEMVAPLAADALFNTMAYRRTETSAVTDALTGLPNSRMLPIAFDEESNRADRYNSKLAMLMIDLDGFKQVNDTFGHLAGDQVLREVAQWLKQQLRAYDKLIRYAGDEFVALLPHADEHSIHDLIARIQRHLESRSHKINGIEVRVGASIGYAIFGRDGYTLDELIRVADEGMYDNKAFRKHDLTPRQRNMPKPVIEEQEIGMIFTEAVAS